MVFLINKGKLNLFVRRNTSARHRNRLVRPGLFLPDHDVYYVMMSRRVSNSMVSVAMRSPRVDSFRIMSFYVTLHHKILRH
jgi:hypothetical protein